MDVAWQAFDKYRQRRKVFAMAGIGAIALGFMVGLILLSGDGQNDSASTDISEGSRQPVWGTAEERQSAREPLNNQLWSWAELIVGVFGDVEPLLGA